ncbi:MAG: hypothetical protein JWP78_746 [Mucilaginibacter sp.]|nr:hypothetical protein [Mucilaginibacter sp.]
MKKIVVISAIAVSGLLFNTADAQIRVHLGFNFGTPVYVHERVAAQPAAIEYVEPANYDGDEDYYYIPEVDAYYSVPEECYYYNSGGRWVSGAYLPGAYRDFNWRNARRYEVRAPRPFMHNDYYRARYNGVAFNGRWDRGYSRGYANENRFNHDQYRTDDRRFNDNGARGGYSRQYNQNSEQHFDNSRGRDRGMGGQQHFAENRFQRNDKGDRDNHRPGRF